HADWAGARLVASSVQPPAAPTGLAATPVSATQINLSWSDVTGETGFKIERSLDGTTGWTQIGTTATNVVTYNDTTAAAGTQYFYRVRATDAGGDGAYSTVANATTFPAAPTGLATSGPTVSQITLNWNDVTGETGYKIERSLDGTTGWTQVGTTAVNVTTFNN